MSYNTKMESHWKTLFSVMSVRNKVLLVNWQNDTPIYLNAFTRWRRSSLYNTQLTKQLTVYSRTWRIFAHCCEIFVYYFFFLHFYLRIDWQLYFHVEWFEIIQFIIVYWNDNGFDDRWARWKSLHVKIKTKSFENDSIICA